MDVDIFDEKGFSIKNTKGELVCKSSFPSKPLFFWKDKNIVKQQIEKWPLYKIENLIYEISEIELLVKKNSHNSLNIVSDFIINQSN